MALQFPPWESPLAYRDTLYLESNESPEGSYYFDRGQVARKIQVDWPARDQAIRDFAGTVEVLYNDEGQGYLRRTTPHPFPPRPWMYVQSIPKEQPCCLRGNDGGTADGLGVARYELCELTLVYAMPTYNIREDASIVAPDGPLAGLPDEGYALEQGRVNHSRYVSWVPRLASKTLELNQGMLKDEDNKLIVSGIPFPEPVGEVLYTWHQVPEEALPVGVWIANGNSVNDATFDIWPAGTLLFDGPPEVRTNPNPMTGQTLADVTYKFKVSIKADPSTDPVTVRGHNYIYRRKVVGDPPVPLLIPRLVTTDGVGNDAGTRMFRDFDFKKFFRPQPAL